MEDKVSEYPEILGYDETGLKYNITKEVVALKAENAALKQRLEHIADLTSIAGVDEPMSVEECVSSLTEKVERLLLYIEEEVGREHMPDGWGEEVDTLLKGADGE
jgi:hypothetical protein